MAMTSGEIAFIDRNVDDLTTLLAGIRPDVEAVQLSDAEPAPRQMARAVKGREGLEAIHVIAHGRPGEVSFAAGALSLETLDECSRELAEIGRSLRDGTIQLWSCRTGCDANGAAFVDALARATGAEVAAAMGLVGAAARGGNWVLENPRAATPAAVPLTAMGQAAYAGLFETVTGSNGTNTISSSASNSTITDGNGSNTVTVTGSNDKVTDGNGTNTVTVSGNNNTVTDGNGSNTVIVTGSNETVTDGNGNNLIYMAATTGNNTIKDGNGTNIIVGGSGNDTITDGNGNNIVYGGAGNDKITDGNGNNVVIAGQGNRI